MHFANAGDFAFTGATRETVRNLRPSLGLCGGKTLCHSPPGLSWPLGAGNPAQADNAGPAVGAHNRADLHFQNGRQGPNSLGKERVQLRGGFRGMGVGNGKGNGGVRGNVLQLLGKPLQGPVLAAAGRAVLTR